MITATRLPHGVKSLSELIEIENTTQTTLYVGVATVALLVYEYLLTLHLEIQYIWKGSKISITTILFCVNRYCPLVRATVYIHYALNPSTDPTICVSVMDFNSYSTMLSVLTVEILMLLRAWALWNRRRDVGFFFIALCCGATIAFVTSVKSIFPPLPRVAPLPPLSVLPCGRAPPSKYVVSYSIALIVEGTSLIFMLGRVVWLGSRVKRHTPILKALQTQGVYYFVVVISAMTFTVLSGYFEKLARPVFFTGITPSIMSLACTRVILALRGLFLHSGTDGPPSYKPGTLVPYRASSTDRKDAGSRRHNRPNLSLDFLVSDAGGTTAQSTSAGVYELTTFGNTTFGMEVSSTAGFTENPASAPSAQIAYGASASIHDKPHIGQVSGYYNPAAVAVPHEGIPKGIQRKVEEGRGGDMASPD